MHTPRRLWTQLVAVVVALVGALVFVPFVPFTDTNYYEYQLHVAFSNGWAFGRDVYGTYGPLGFLGLPFYSAGTYRYCLIFGVVLLVTLALAMAKVWRQRVGPVTARFFLWTAVVVISPTLFVASREWGAPLAASYLVALLLVLLPRDARRLRLGLYALLGVMALIKTLILVLSLLVVGVLTVEALATRRKVPLGAAVYLVLLGLSWLAAGQALSDFPAFLGLSSDVAIGFREVPNLWSADSVRLSLVFAAGGLTHWALVAVGGWRERRLRSLPLTLTWAAILYTLFSHGYVRADLQHIWTAVLLFCSLVTLLDLWFRSRCGPWARHAARACAVFVFAINVSSLGGPAVLKAAARSAVARLSRASRCFTEGAGAAPQELEERLRALREHYPLPAWVERVDIQALDPGIALANGRQLQPRPSIASFMAWTPSLMVENARSLSDRAGPDAVLMSRHQLFDAHPAMVDSLSYLSLISDFRLEGRREREVLFRRRVRPRQLSLSLMQERRATLGAAVSAPTPSAGAVAVWVRVLVKQNAAGRALSRLYKTFPLDIALAFDDGSVRTYPFFQRLAAVGFLLSPSLETVDQLEQFYGATGKAPWVKRLLISQRQLRDLELPSLYEQEISVSFYELRVGSGQ